MLKHSYFLVPLFFVMGCSSNKNPAKGRQDAAAEASTPAVSLPQPDCSADSTDWPMFGQNVCNTSSQANAAGIGVDTVGKLAVKWQYDKKAGAAGEVSATPAVVSGGVYFPDWGGNINRLDAMTGSLVWSKGVADLLSASGYPGSLGGFVSRDTPLVTQGLVIFGTVRDPPQVITSQGTGAYVIAITQDTGAVKWVKNLDPHPAAVITGSPVLDGNTLYVGVASQEEYGGLAKRFGIDYKCCSFRGSAAALDVMTGQVKWQTYTIGDDLFYGSSGPPEGGLPADAAPPPMSGYTGVAIWSSTPVVDRKRNQLIVATGDNYSIPDGGAGTPKENWVDSIVTLDLTTGKMNWAQQLPNAGMSPSDAFAVGVSTGPDSDFGAGANLYTAMVNGQPKDLVGAGQKSGYVFAFDAQTGDIVWKTNIGQGGSLGGIQWGIATDAVRIYAGNNNSRGPWTLLGNGPSAGQQVTTGTWTALNAATGEVVWQVADPALDTPLSGASVNGPVAVVNGVMFGGSMDKDGTMFALNAATGEVLWQFQSGATVYGGPAISGGMVYWGSGYPGVAPPGQPIAKRPLGFGTLMAQAALYAFSVK
jgi:polyvinyl alcohol dehydrogenase (cytochrome)